jgi:hypothetical protein
MKALSIKQPWAWAICAGFKPVENRSWSTPFRGSFLIHAGQRLDKDGVAFVEAMLRERFADGLPPAAFARGGIVGAAMLRNVVRAHDSPWFFGPYGFTLERPLSFPDVIPCKGALGIRTPPLTREQWSQVHSYLRLGWLKAEGSA